MNFPIQKKLYFIFLFLITSIQAWSQFSIQGKVQNAEHTPIILATVLVQKDSLLIGAAVTDSLGNFFIPSIPKGKYLLVCKSLNYNTFTQTIALNSDAQLQITLADSVHTLKDVSIDAKKPLFVRKGDRFVFTPNKWVAAGINGLQLMRYVPLVIYNENDDFFSIINKTNTTVYINNRKSNLPRQTIVAMLKALPAENIKNIEIITNPGSEYNADITGGIININITRNVNEGWMGNIQLNTQQSVYNTTQLNGSVNYNKHQLALQFIPFLSSNFNYNTGYNSFAYTNQSKDSTTINHYRRYTVLGGGLNADYYINNNNTLSYKGWFSSVNGNTIDNNLIYHQPSNQSAFNNPLQTYVNGTDHYIYNFGNVYFHHQFDSLNKQNIDVNVDYNKFYQEQNSVGNFNQLNQQGNLIGNIGAYYNHLPQNFFNLSERVEYGNQLSNHVRWILGIQFSQTQVDNNLKYFNGNYNNYTLDTALSKHYAYTENYGSGYTSFAYTISDKWQMNIGGRIETTQYNTQEKNTGISKDSNYVNFFPSFALSYAANAKNNFGFSFARKIMRPSIELLFPGRTYYSPTFFAQNNPFLQPQLYNNAEFTYVYNNVFSIVASYSHIQNAYSNFIVPVVEDNQNKFNSTYLNYGASNTYAIVFSFYKSIINDRWQSYINTAFNYTHYTGNTNVANIQLNNANGIMNWENYVYLNKKKDWMAYIALHYNTPQQTLAAKTLNGISNLDVMLKKTYKNFSFYIYLADIYNGSSKIWQILFANPLFTGNNSFNNTYNRSISLNVAYQFGNRNLKTVSERNIANQDIKKRTGN